MFPKFINVIFAVLCLVMAFENLARNDWVWGAIFLALTYSNVWIYFAKAKKDKD